MGILLLPWEKKIRPWSNGFNIKNSRSTQKLLRPNPVVRSLNIVYSLLQEDTVSISTPLNKDSESVDRSIIRFRDPSYVPVTFKPIQTFEEDERVTRMNLDTKK